MPVIRHFLWAVLLSAPLAAQANPCIPPEHMTQEQLRAALAKANDARVAAHKRALEALKNEIAQRGKSGMSEQAQTELEARTAKAYRDAKAASDAHRKLMEEGQRRLDAAKRAREAQRAAQGETSLRENWNQPKTPPSAPMGPGNENPTIPGEPPTGWGDGGPRTDPALADTIPGRPPTGSGASGPPSTGSRGGGGGDPALEDTLPGWEPGPIYAPVRHGPQFPAGSRVPPSKMAAGTAGVADTFKPKK